MNEMNPVLVTTEHRGVFFGWLPKDADAAQKTLTLQRCRCAIYWAGTRGFLGLAAHGPDEGSRIGAEAPSVMLHDITSVSWCTAEAAERWSNWQ